MYDNVILDWDGTLADTTDGIAAVKRIAAGLAKLEDTDQARWLEMRSLAIRQQAEQLFPNDTRRQTLVVSAYLRAYSDRVLQVNKLMPGVVDFATNMCGRNLAINTNMPAPFIRQTLTNHGLKQYFRTVVGCFDVVEAKPHPEGVLWIIGQLQLQKNGTVMLGDSPIDLETATSAGIDFIGITTGAHSREQLLAAGAKVVVASLAEARELICG